MTKLEHCETCGKLLPDCVKCQKWHNFGKDVPSDHNTHYAFDYKIEVFEEGNVVEHLYCRECFSKITWKIDEVEKVKSN